jgi:hypothetical protein
MKNTGTEITEERKRCQNRRNPKQRNTRFEVFGIHEG